MKKDLNIHHLADVKEKGARYINLPAFLEFPELIAGFTTRFGGVSTGEFATLNLSFTRSDIKANVLKNYKLLSEDLDVPLNNMVLSHQTHSRNVMPVSKEHSGMGITKNRDYTDIDGLITDENSLMLITYYADCVPLYLYDPVRRVIGLTHSGWKGTLQDIAGETIRKMCNIYGSNPSDIHAAFGPHIRNCCFEVDSDVAKEFKKINNAKEHMFLREDGKWMIDLENIITESFKGHGIKPGKIYKCNICTKCHKDVF
ncbi:MAG: peptidoglycan editing factor PgeF, partial [Clostridiaceae bacterium]|nr:peptidoglycan editing factor PgeF [Clostridiaceae bacterium]